MKIATVVGARPQFIKAAALSRVLRTKADTVEILIHTGQHYDDNMSDIFFEELDLPPPNYNLGIGSKSHGAQTGQMLEALELVIAKETPDWVLVYGDTNSTLAGALAAAKMHVSVAHVEAGLRSFNRRMPEEINRVVTDHLSTLLFAPTGTAVKNLASEGIARERIFLVGDVMYDAALYYGGRAETTSGILARLGLKPNDYSVITVHRAETTDTPGRLRAIVEGLVLAAEHHHWVFPMHPRTKRALERYGLLEELVQHVQVLEPIGYLDMVMLEKHARCIATDSGGVQKEAFFYQVPCVTLRDETEWVELVHLGWNKLVPPLDGTAVAKGLADAITGNGYQCDHAPELYGGGHAAPRIVDILKRTSAK